MKTLGKLIIFLFTFLVLTASAYAQSPREQLNQMTQQLQKTPTDDALREKIIKLARTMKPAPALPDTAVAFEGRAQFAFRSAKSEGDFLAAAHEYEKAVATAPWVPGYYADLCTIYEKAGKFEDAKRHCGFYLTGLTDPTQITDVKRRIGGLEFGIEKARRPSFQGKWRISVDTIVGECVANDTALEITEYSPNQWRVGHDDPRVTPDVFAYDLVSNVKTSGRQLSFRVQVPTYTVFGAGYRDFSLTLSEDGSRLAGHRTFIRPAGMGGPGRCEDTQQVVFRR